jgi:hypothetical protein
MEARGSLPYAQQLVTGPYPDADKSSRRLPILVTIVLILSFYLRLVLPSGLFPSVFSTKSLCSVSAICPAQFILVDLLTRVIFGSE